MGVTDENPTPPEPKYRRPPARHARRDRRHPLRWIALGLVGVLVLGGGYVAYSYERFQSGVTKIDALPAPGKSGGSDVDGQDENILLVGDDHRPAGATAEQLAELGTTSDGGSSNTDTMIVLHVSGDRKSATMISLPRDSYVDIPGHGKNKLNSAFSAGSATGGPSGGAKLLISTVQNLTGLTIDHYMRVSLLGFYEVVKALGPVEVCLNNAVQDDYSKIDLPAGKSTLSPKEAVAFVRQRHGLPRGDFDREVRQQYFLSVEAKRILSAGTLLNPVKSGRIIDAVSKSIETDEGFDLVSFATSVRDLRPANIRSATIPVLGTPTIDVNGTPLSIVEVDTAGMPGFITNVVGQPEAYTKATAAKPAAVSALVVNASGVEGAAVTASTRLTALGFTVGAPESGTLTQQTTVQYAKGAERAAKALVAKVPGAEAVLTPGIVGVRLVLGSDGRTVRDPAATATPKPSTSTAPAAPATPKPTVTKQSTAYAGTCIN